MSFLEDNKSYFEKPVKVQVDVTNYCNLNCLYCYNKSNDFSSKSDLDDKDIFLIANKVIDELTPIVLSLSGGEPLLKKNLITKIIQSASENGIETWLTSNLLLLDLKTAISLKKAGLKKIFTNIDAVDFTVHDFLRGKAGAYAKTITNLKSAKKIFGAENITITSVITKYNYKNLDSMLDFLHKNEFTRLKLLDFIPINKNSIKEVLSKKQWLEFYSLFKTADKKAQSFGIKITPCHSLLFMGDYYKKMKFPFCVAGRFNLVILATGEILPCNHLKYKAFCCGNALTDSLLDVWQKSTILNKFRYDLKDYRSCKKCVRFTKCAGGCKALSYAFNNCAFNQDPYCQKYKLNQTNCD